MGNRANIIFKHKDNTMELNTLLKEQDRLKVAVQRYEKNKQRIKELMQEQFDAGKDNIVTGDYVVTAKMVHRDGYTVEPCDYLDVRAKLRPTAKQAAVLMEAK